MGEELKVWTTLLGNFGLPIVFVLWYFVVDRPAQRKREEDIEARGYLRMQEALKDRDKVNDANWAANREHQMAIAKLQGEIHLAATKELITVIEKADGKVTELAGKLDEALENYRRGPNHGPNRNRS